MRAFAEVTKDLGLAMDDAIGKKNNVDKVTVQSDEMIRKAGEMKTKANNEFAEAQDKVFSLRKEYNELMDSIAPMSAQGHVRQSK